APQIQAKEAEKHDTQPEPKPPIENQNPDPRPAPINQPAAVISPVQVSELIMETYLIRSSKPIYPHAAQSAGIEGLVVLAALIEKDGTVKKLKPLVGDPRLSNAFMNSVGKWKYRPYPNSENPVPVETRITYNFHLPAIQPVSSEQYGIVLSTNITPY